jgi:methylenetetrahydrofolate--tRNA-(uracil-5-)-methyltransferase
MPIAVVGAGLAGCECAYTLAQHYNTPVTLFEMKSKNPTPAQDAPNLFAELVCSNSLKSTSHLNPAGILKDEMESLGSLLIPIAKTHSVPAGETLAVDRSLFSQDITNRIRNHPNITVVETEITSAQNLAADPQWDAVVIATGPLTSQALADDLCELTHSSNAFFYDAIAPVVDGDSIDMTVAFWQNRTTRTAAYQKRQQQELHPPQSHSLQNEKPELSTGDYLNIPLNKDEYFEFVKRLLEGDKVPFHAFESPKFFSGCQPIEALAESGPRTLSFGPMKARGITNPHTGRSPWACVQLRRESLGNNAFNMVGFQTRLAWPAQKEIFRTLPALKNAEFFRMGSMHRNTYFCAPQVLSKDFSLKNNPKIFLAGQIMGVEGYIESAAIGLYVGHVIGRNLTHKKGLAIPPAETSLGALMRYIFFAEAKHFVPMNIHWGLFDALDETTLQELPDSQKKKKIDKSLKRDLLSQRARKHFASWKEESQF